MSITQFYKHFKKIVEQMGVPEFRPHDLRHTFTTVSIANGIDVRTVQEFLGHATPDFTLKVYTHVNADMRNKAVDKMQNIYNRFIG